jgi:hypothetical protein
MAACTEHTQYLHAIYSQQAKVDAQWEAGQAAAALVREQLEGVQEQLAVLERSCRTLKDGLDAAGQTATAVQQQLGQFEQLLEKARIPAPPLEASVPRKDEAAAPASAPCHGETLAALAAQAYAAAAGFEVEAYKHWGQQRLEPRASPAEPAGELIQFKPSVVPEHKAVVFMAAGKGKFGEDGLALALPDQSQRWWLLPGLRLGQTQIDAMWRSWFDEPHGSAPAGWQCLPELQREATNDGTWRLLKKGTCRTENDGRRATALPVEPVPEPPPSPAPSALQAAA